MRERGSTGRMKAKIVPAIEPVKLINRLNFGMFIATMAVNMTRKVLKVKLFNYNQ